MPCRIQRWDVLLCGEFSRLAQDSEDLGWIRNQLRLHRKTAREASTGLDIFNVGSKVMYSLSEEYPRSGWLARPSTPGTRSTHA